MDTKSSQNNWHSPLDSANNRVYNIVKDKERDKKEEKESRKFILTIILKVTVNKKSKCLGVS